MWILGKFWFTQHLLAPALGLKQPREEEVCQVRQGPFTPGVPNFFWSPPRIWKKTDSCEALMFSALLLWAYFYGWKDRVVITTLHGVGARARCFLCQTRQARWLIIVQLFRWTRAVQKVPSHVIWTIEALWLNFFSGQPSYNEVLRMWGGASLLVWQGGALANNQITSLCFNGFFPYVFGEGFSALAQLTFGTR